MTAHLWRAWVLRDLMTLTFDFLTLKYGIANFILTMDNQYTVY